MGVQSSSGGRLKPFFLALVQQSFDQLRMGDRDIADYLATVLTDFSRSDRLLWLREGHGYNLRNAVEKVVASLGSDIGERRLNERALRKHVGDYTLFMSGLFRSFVERHGVLDIYLAEGKRAYHAVSELDVALYRPGFLLFEELSQRFESYAGALDYMRKCYFVAAPGNNPFAGFLRQIEHLVRGRLSNN
jgi:hypothetical protein